MARDWVSDGPRVVGQGVVGDWIGIEAEGNLDDYVTRWLGEWREGQISKGTYVPEAASRDTMQQPEPEKAWDSWHLPT